MHPPPAIEKHLLTISRCQIVEKLLGPLWEGAPPAGGGGESFTQERRFRAKARLSPSGPSGHLPPRGRFFDTQTPAYHKQVYFCLEFLRFLLCKEGTKPRIIPSRPDTRGVRRRTPRPDDHASTFRRPAAHCTPRPGRSSTPPACGKAARAGTAYS